MSIKTQIKKLEHYQVTQRSLLTRGAALVVALATIFSLSELGHNPAPFHDKRRAVLHTRASLSKGAENETVRMPIKFDDGLRATATASQ